MGLYAVKGNREVLIEDALRTEYEKDGFTVFEMSEDGKVKKLTTYATSNGDEIKSLKADITKKDSEIKKLKAENKELKEVVETLETERAEAGKEPDDGVDKPKK